MLYEFHRGLKATEATRNINRVCQGAVQVRSCQMWFARFCEGDFNLKDEPRSNTLSVDHGVSQLIEEIVNINRTYWSIIR